MFCSKCGRTIPQGNSKCLSCGIEINDTEFSAASYIASQPAPGQEEKMSAVQPRTRFTRTSYTTMADENADDVYRRTSYRPVYQEPEKEEEEKAPAAEETAPENETAAQEQAVSADPQELPEDMRSRPLREIKIGGISPQMAQWMKKSEEEAAAEAELPPRPARPSVSAIFSSIGRGAKSIVPKRRQAEYEEYEEEYDGQYDEETYEQDENAAGVYEETEQEEYYDEDAVFDTSDIEEEEYDEPRAPLFSFRRNAEPLSSSAKIVRTVIAAVVILALCAGGFVWLSLETAAKSPIGGVTYTVYEQAIAMLEEHTTPVYKKSMASLYEQDPTGGLLLSRQTEDQAKFMALLPGTPQVNDSDFIGTVISIQSTIDIAVTLDVMSGDTFDQAASNARWNAITNAIKRLKSASSVTEFEAIASSAAVSATPTPAPTATPSPYSTLHKGMTDNDEVRAMQNRLYELGWFTDVRDGDFGALTQTAIKQFQQAAGLSVTGMADPETLAAIYAEDAPRTGAKITPAPTAPAAE